MDIKKISRKEIKENVQCRKENYQENVVHLLHQSLSFCFVQETDEKEYSEQFNFTFLINISMAVYCVFII